MTKVEKFLHKSFAPATWRNPTTLAEIERALDGGKLYVPKSIDRSIWYLARRSGETKLWKTRPAEYRIPIKYGFRDNAAIEHGTTKTLLRIADSREEAEHEGPNAH